MADRTAPEWTLTGWTEAIERWTAQEQPDDLVRHRLSKWLKACAENPYWRAHRTEGIPNLWWAEVPESARDGRAVVCSYWIEERAKRVRGDMIATLSQPVT